MFAKFERNLDRGRQLEAAAAAAAAKARGVCAGKGRKPTIDAAQVRRLKEEEKLGAVAIARRLKVGRASVYRALGAEPGDEA